MQPMIKVSHVTHHYGIRPVLRDVTFEVGRGELVALMGPNGMGKSTLLGVIGGVLSPRNGFVEVDGHRRRRSADEEMAARRVTAYLPDHPWLPQNRTGREFIISIGRLYERDDDTLVAHSKRLLDLFQLDQIGDTPIRNYSNGQKKKVAIAAILVTAVPVLILDEPFTGGLDPAAILALRRVLQNLIQKAKVTVLMATQLSEIAEVLAQRVLVLRDGSLLAYETIPELRRMTATEGPLEEVLEKLIHPDALERIEKYFAGENA